MIVLCRWSRRGTRASTSTRLRCAASTARASRRSTSSTRSSVSTAMPPRCAPPLANVPRLWCSARLAQGCVAVFSHRRFPLCSHTDDCRCVQAFLQTNSDLRLFCPSKRIADLVSRSPGRNTSAFLYYFSRGPRPGDWLSNQQVRPSSLLSDSCVTQEAVTKRSDTRQP